MITLKTDAGSFEIPERLDELTISQVFEFYAEDEKFLEGDKLNFLLSALSAVYGDVGDLPMGDIEDRFEIGSELTAFGLYRYTVELINDYAPKHRKDFIVEHHGQTYMINPQEAENIQRSVGFTVGEVITVKTFLDYAVKRKSRGLENVDFNLSLEQIATILRKPGERLPVHVDERTRFIDARKREFADLPYPMAIDIIFFLMTTTSESKTT